MTASDTCLACGATDNTDDDRQLCTRCLIVALRGDVAFWRFVALLFLLVALAAAIFGCDVRLNPAVRIGETYPVATPWFVQPDNPLGPICRLEMGGSVALLPGPDPDDRALLCWYQGQPRDRLSCPSCVFLALEEELVAFLDWSHPL